MPRLDPKSSVLRLPLGLSRAPRGSRVRGPLAILLVACATALAVSPMDARIRALASALLVVLAAVGHLRRSRRTSSQSGVLAVDATGVHRSDGGRAVTLVRFDEPFGLTVFSTADRSRFRIALTSPRAARYLFAAVHNAEDAASAPTLLAHAATASDDDLAGGDESALLAADAEKLLRAVARHAPAAFERIFLSDSRGEAVVVDPGELGVGSHRIDLLAPLEWRASIFQEALPQAIAFYQATWVRQAEVEVVFVAPLATFGALSEEPSATVCAAGLGTVVRRSLARDLRLLQAGPEKPPPREDRHAIERPFMLPLRRVLDDAPRPSRAERTVSNSAARAW